MRDNSILVKGAEKIGIVLSEKQQQQFEAYYDYLVTQNEVMNLTAITEYEEVLTKHFLHRPCERLPGKRCWTWEQEQGFREFLLKLHFRIRNLF